MTTDLTPFEDGVREFLRVEMKKSPGALEGSFTVPSPYLLDFKAFAAAQPALAELILKAPEMLIPFIQNIFEGELPKLDIDGEKKSAKLVARFYNVGEPRLISSLRAENDLNTLVSISGMIQDISQVKRIVDVGLYTCKFCDEEHQVEVGRRSREPVICASCKRRSLVLDEDRSKWTDVQYVTIQDLPEFAPEQPHTISITMPADFVTNRALRLGERVIVAGSFHVRPIMKKTATTVYENYLNCESVVSLTSDLSRFTEEEVREFIKFSKEQHCKAALISTLGTFIEGYEDVKLGLLLSLFGAAPMNDEQSGEIHVLMSGDPGVAKSDLLREALKLATKGRWVSGKSASKTGFTVVHERAEDGMWRIKAGVCVLMNNGHVFIDELNTVTKEDKEALYEPMAQGTVSPAKAGSTSIGILKARCAIIATANPIHGRFDPTLQVSQQFDMAPQLHSRFDLTFIFRDMPDEKRDAKISDSMLRLRIGTLKSPKPIEFVKRYIAYARKVCFPKISENLIPQFSQFYSELRAEGNKQGTIWLTPRENLAAIKISEAHARMHLRSEVTQEDLDVAFALIQKTLAETALDLTTGKIDVGLKHSGVTSSARNLNVFLIRHVSMNGKCTKAQLIELAKREFPAMNLIDHDIYEMIEKLKTGGVFFEPQHGEVQIAE